MASTYASKVGFSNTNTVHTYNQTSALAPTMNIKPRVTAGLGTTHGLRKLEGGTSLNAILEQVSSYKFKDYFLDFDRLRKGHVSESRFRSGLGMVNTEFTESDVQTLVDKYRIDQERINYKAFCDDVDR